MGKSQVVSLDGTSRLEYRAGLTYDVPDDQAQAWIAAGVAENPDAPPAEPTPRPSAKRKGGGN